MEKVQQVLRKAAAERRALGVMPEVGDAVRAPVLPCRLVCDRKVAVIDEHHQQVRGTSRRPGQHQQIL